MRWKRQIAIPCFAGTGATTARDDGVVCAGLRIGQGWVGVRKYGKLVDSFKSYPPEEAQFWKIITYIINGKIAKIITD